MSTAGGARDEEQTDLTVPTNINFYGGASRFELELEFVQCLSNPLYLQHLSLNHYFDSDEFLNYCKYLQYFAKPEYVRYLSYPGPTLKALKLVQDEQFRKDILRPDVLDRLANEWMTHATHAENTT